MKLQREVRAATSLPGGDWSLDFANAVEDWEASYAQLLAWSWQVGLVDEHAAEVMARRAETDPQGAWDALERARSLRMLIHGIFWAIAHGQTPDAGQIADLNALLPSVLDKLRVVRSGDGFRWTWDGRDQGLDRMLWPVAHAAAELLMASDLRWLKACAGEDCDRLFLDLSRNHSRRWCEMQHCGMLVKSRRHYAKKRQARTAAMQIIT